MKKLLIGLILGMSVAVTSYAATVKTVCHTDTKTQKKVCKKIKVHKKLVGTKVPVKK